MQWSGVPWDPQQWSVGDWIALQDDRLQWSAAAWVSVGGFHVYYFSLSFDSTGLTLGSHRVCVCLCVIVFIRFPWAFP